MIFVFAPKCAVHNTGTNFRLVHPVVAVYIRVGHFGSVFILEVCVLDRYWGTDHIVSTGMCQKPHTF